MTKISLRWETTLLNQILTPIIPVIKNCLKNARLSKKVLDTFSIQIGSPLQFSLLSSLCTEGLSSTSIGIEIECRS